MATTGKYISTTEEKQKIAACCGCPINKGCDTRMTKKGFIEACMDNRENAQRVASGLNNRWKKSTTYTCLHCKIGKKVQNDLVFKPPPKIEFIKLDKAHPIRKPKAEPCHSNARLNIVKVKNIRVRHASGEKTRILAKEYDVTPRTILAVVNRETWCSI